MAALPILMAALLWAPAAQAQAAPDSFADLVEELLPTVVNISTLQVVEATEGSKEYEEFFREFFERGGEQPQRRQQSSLGSGCRGPKQGRHEDRQGRRPDARLS